MLLLLIVQPLVLSVCSGFVLTTPARNLHRITTTKRPPFRTSLSVANPLSFHSDDEWHPHDPAYTTAQLMAGIWHQIAQASSMVKGVSPRLKLPSVQGERLSHIAQQESMTVLYPDMESDLNTPRYLNLLLGHLDVCKDVCDYFGISTTLVPYTQQAKIVGFTAKSYRNADAKDEYDFDYDPFWDDGTDFETLYAGIDDEFMEADPYPAIETPVPDDDEEIIDLTKKWVDKMMADMGICPFTSDAEKAGLPIGPVFYAVDRNGGVEDMYARYWKEVVRVEQNKEKDLSTSLLIVPEFFMDNVELFESFSTTLTQALTALDVEDLLQLVFFHPHWVFRDGDARAGEGQAANYARRSPWPMINILRTNQVRAAQKGIPTGLVYKQNEKTLAQVGVDKLETMLRLRDWSPIADMKVNRRESDALKMAQDFQAKGKVDTSSIKLEHDATPAANKVDRKQVEQGDLVKVLMQALEKRLGKADGVVQRLSGPETSATAMAADFLLQELDRIIETAPPEVSLSQEETNDSRAARIAAAKRALMEDLMGDNQSTAGPDMSDVLFGKGGISEKSGENFNKGLDPDTFY